VVALSQVSPAALQQAIAMADAASKKSAQPAATAAAAPADSAAAG